MNIHVKVDSNYWHMIWGYGRLSREIKGVIGSTVHVATMYLINIKILLEFGLKIMLFFNLHSTAKF